MKTIVLSLFAIALMTGYSSCYYDNPPGELPIAVENISFNRDIVPIFSGSCLGEGCHAGDHEPTLTLAEAYTSLTEGVHSSGKMLVNLTIPEESPLYNEVRSGNMPPTGALSRVEIEFIKAWIQKGALND